MSTSELLKLSAFGTVAQIKARKVSPVDDRGSPGSGRPLAAHPALVYHHLT